MGLVEKRAAKEFETKVFPGIQSEIHAAAGFPVPVEVDWESLTLPDQAQLYDEGWRAVYFTPLVAALKAITIDDMGKEALQAGLKKVVVKNTAGVYSANAWATFDGGVLTLDHEPTTNMGDVNERIKGAQEVLEKAL